MTIGSPLLVKPETMPTCPPAAAHGHDSPDLRSDVLVLLPGQSAVIHVLSPGDLPQERRAPKAGADANLMGGVADKLASAIHSPSSCAQPTLESRLKASEERLLLGSSYFDLGDASVVMVVVMAMVMPWARFSGRKRQSDDRGADQRRCQFSQDSLLLCDCDVVGPASRRRRIFGFAPFSDRVTISLDVCVGRQLGPLVFRLLNREDLPDHVGE